LDYHAEIGDWDVKEDVDCASRRGVSAELAGVRQPDPLSNMLLRTAVIDMAETLRINEIFHSIQGESTFAGRPCVFVRLTGCHLRCRYCDTEYAFRAGAMKPISEIIEDVESFSCNLVEITGGEPLLQPGVHLLMKQFADRGKTVLLETSGCSDISTCDPRVIRIVDFKTPSSGETGRNIWKNIDYLAPCDEVKFVIGDRADFDWAREVVTKHQLHAKVHAILFSPVYVQEAGVEIRGMKGLEARLLAEWLLEDSIPKARMQLQMHKFIWEPSRRGV